MAFGFGDGDHGREIAVMVYDRVHLDAALGRSELGPGEQVQAQVEVKSEICCKLASTHPPAIPA